MPAKLAEIDPLTIEGLDAALSLPAIDVTIPLRNIYRRTSIGEP